MILRLLALLPLVLSDAAVWADAKLAQPAGPVSELRVTLFGQPCLLTGPVDETGLKAIHAISPEKAPPPETADEARALLDRLKKMPPGVPVALDRYREKLVKRVAAMLAFYDGLAAAKKGGKAEALLKSVKEYVVPGKRAKAFDALARKTDFRKSEAIEALTNTYGEAVEPSPEEEFHRSIQRLNVHYNCSFEEGESD